MSLYSTSNVTIFGNVTRTPDVRVTPSGSTIGTFGIALNDKYKNKDGEWVDAPTVFVDCVSFNEGICKLLNHIQKGQKVLVIGKLRDSSYEDKETGKKVYKTSVAIHSLSFTGSERNQSEGALEAQRKPAPRSTSPIRREDPPEMPAGEDDDVPF